MLPVSCFVIPYLNDIVVLVFVFLSLFYLFFFIITTTTMFLLSLFCVILLRRSDNVSMDLVK
jgi:ABC-type transport system involved in Fe-S cluster assembly fused permease/ATPase subunit